MRAVRGTHATDGGERSLASGDTPCTAPCTSAAWEKVAGAKAAEMFEFE